MAEGHIPGPQAPASSGFEFELTDFATARAAHDAIPEGVGVLPDRLPDFWNARRRRPVATDKALTGATIAWLLSLPPSRRPHTLCERYPRVANALAAVWTQPQAREEFIAGLGINRPGGRMGFPIEVQRELDELRWM